MALSGVHVTFGYCADSAIYKSSATLPYVAVSHETMASPATSSKSAPAQLASSALGKSPVLMSVSASAAIFYVVGPSPNINTDARRYYDPALNAREDIFVNAGDKIAWTFA